MTSSDTPNALSNNSNTSTNFTTTSFGGSKKSLTEQDLLDCGFSQHLMLGTGWNSIASMRDAVYYYKSPNKRITINCTTFWSWFLDDNLRNDIRVSSLEELLILIKTYS